VSNAAKDPLASEEVIHHFEDLRLSEDSRANLYRSILEASTLDPEYLTMLMVAGLIALLGLLQNSVAVIIGAMLISPLMNPILAGGLALVLGDWKLGRKAGGVLVLSISLVIVATWLASELVPLRQATPEILARTNPNLLDLFIAMLSGLAGTLAMRAPTSAYTIIPGVAIAVAVVPPLATVGYGLSGGNLSIAGGAFLLFVTNLVSIMICAGLVFLLFGFRPRDETEQGHLKLKYRMAISAGVLFILAVPLVQTLRQAVGQIRTKSTISSVIHQAFGTPSSAIDALSFERKDGGLIIHAVVRTTEYFEDKSVTSAEESLRRHFGDGTRLELEQILVAQGKMSAQQAARARNFISGAAALSPVEEAAYDLRKSSDQMLSYVQKTADELLGPAGPALRRLGPVEAQLSAGSPMNLTLHLAAGEPLQPQTLQLLAGQLSSRLSYPVQLRARVSLEGEGNYLRLEKTDAGEGLNAAERRAVAQFAARLKDQAGLSLDIIVMNQIKEETGPKPPLQREIEALLLRSGLPESRWRVRVLPPSPVGRVPPLPGSDSQRAVLRVELRLIQEI
jgi:uncharacterized hydrophobic protein (TIGR00271 family)